MEDDDYEHVNTIVTFEEEVMEIRWHVRILDNHILEPTKTFSAVIEAVAGRFPVSVMNSTTTVEIKDDDCKCSLYIAWPALSSSSVMLQTSLPLFYLAPALLSRSTPRVATCT